MSRPSQYIKSSPELDSRFISLLINDNSSLGKEAQLVYKSYGELASHYTEPMSRSSKDLAAKFYALQREWEQETAHLSNATQIAIHPAYQKMIGMGKDILPFIMNELATRPNLWFWALKSITGEDPVPPRLRGRIKEMANVWLWWWSKNKQRYE